MLVLRRPFTLLAATLFVSSAGCKGPAPPIARSFKLVVVERLPPPPEGIGRRPESQRKMQDAAVYLDGKPIGVLKHSELPPSLKPHAHKLLDGREVPRYRVAEMAESMGAHLEKITEVHLYGGGRTSILAGDELRRHKDDLMFSFTRGTEGKPRMHWPETATQVNTTIDGIAAITIYEAKAPPKYDPKTHVFSFEDGKPIEGIPYTPKEDTVKGTRIYVDGVLVGALKRKTLPNKVLANDSTPASPRFSLVRFLDDLGVDEQGVQGVEILVGENVIDRFDAASWRTERESLEFAIPRRNQGKMLMFFPPADAVVKAMKTPATDPSVRVSAIQIYKKVPLSKRTLAPMEEVLAHDDSGSGNDQGTGGDGGGKQKDPTSAQGVLGEPEE